MADTRTVLSIRGAERRYRADHAALAGADLDLHAGRITALLGPSGSGKSTLLRAIAGLERLEAGSICLGDTIWNDTATHVAPEARRVGMVFQDYALFPHMTALANVAFGLTGPDKNAAPKPSWRRPNSVTRPKPIRTSCPAASSNASPSPGRWRRSRPSSCWTNLSPASTGACAPSCANARSTRCARPGAQP